MGGSEKRNGITIAGNIVTDVVKDIDVYPSAFPASRAAWAAACPTSAST